MSAVDVGLGQHIGNDFRVRMLVGIIKGLEHELRRFTRYGKTLRHRRALFENAGKIGLCPYGRKVDAAVVKSVGVDQTRNEAEWQIIAVDGMRCEQRPAGLELDGPETVELD